MHARALQLLAPTAFQCYTPRIFLGREVRA